MTSLHGVLFESLFDFAISNTEAELHYYRTNPKAMDGLRVKDPKWANPHGPHYRMHPELTRAGGPGVYVAAAVTGYAGVPVALAAANYAIIENDVPEEQRSGYWQMYSSALTGTFGGGFSGIV